MAPLNFRTSWILSATGALIGFCFKLSYSLIKKVNTSKWSETLEDGKSTFICIPEGLRSLFKHHFVRDFRCMISSALSKLKHGTNHQYASRPQPHLVVRAGNKRHQPPPILTHQNLSCHSKSKPWNNPDDSIKLYIKNNHHKKCKVHPNEPQWKMDVICDWP